MPKPTVREEIQILREEMRSGFAKLSTQDALSEQERKTFRSACRDLVQFSQDLVKMRQDLHNLTNTLSVDGGITNRTTRLEEQVKTLFKNQADNEKKIDNLATKHESNQKDTVAKASAGSTAILAGLAAAAKALGLF